MSNYVVETSDAQYRHKHPRLEGIGLGVPEPVERRALLRSEGSKGIVYCGDRIKSLL